MPQIIVLPSDPHCPSGAVIDSEIGVSICDALLAAGIHIEHACEKSCACTTCHVYVREGGSLLNETTDAEDDLLDRAWGLDPDSRLSCQAIMGETDVVVEIPKYTINQVAEGGH